MATVVHFKFGAQESNFFQILANIYTGVTMVRSRADNEWKEWHRWDSFGCNTPTELASLLGVVNFRTELSQNYIYSLGTIGIFSSCRIIGSNYHQSNGIIDFTVFGNNGNITARGNAGNIKVYVASRNVFVQAPSGTSINALFCSQAPVLVSSLPSGATQLTVNPY